MPRPPDSTVPRPSSPPEGKSSERTLARPMSTRHVRGPVIVGRMGPAGVLIANSSCDVHPARRRYMIASRAPLPDRPDSEPSGLKMRSAATNSGSAERSRSRTPSAPTPVCGSHRRRTRCGVRANGSASPSTMR